MSHLYEQEIKNRRERLFKEIKKESGQVVIINYENQNDFTQQKPFPHYLARWLNLPFYQKFTLVLHGDKNHNFESILFVDTDDPAKSIWDCGICEISQAKNKYQVDRIEKINDSLGYFHDFIIDHRKEIIYYHDISNNPNETELSQLILSLEAIIKPGVNLLSPEEIIDQLRLIKSDFEIEMILHACQISREAHINVLQNIKPGLNESYLDGIFIGHIKMKGCSRTAYPNIIGSGINSTTLHYHENNQILEEGELLLIDAGAEYQGYASDITRTYPISGRFNKFQRNIYSLVLKVQDNCIKMIRPGITFNDLQDCAVKLITQGLINLGLLVGNIEEIIEAKAYDKFFMHGIGHWLGLEVHDCQFIPTIISNDDDEKPIQFESGMVITVEPGIYIGKYVRVDKFVDMKKYREYYGIGIRIEDDVMVTINGYKILSDGIPKEIDEIEHFISKE